MTIRKNTLWRVPVFCIAAGVVAINVIVYLLSRFAIVRLPDGSVTTDEMRSLLIYALIFAVLLLLGGLVCFRGMTKKEIALSASIAVVINLLVILFQLAFTGGSNQTLALMAIWFGAIFEWSSFVTRVLHRLLGSTWFGTLANCLMPMVFVAFGKEKFE